MSGSFISPVSIAYYIRLQKNSSAQWTRTSQAELKIEQQHKFYYSDKEKMPPYISLSASVITGCFLSTERRVYILLNRQKSTPKKQSIGHEISASKTYLYPNSSSQT